jgi:hypothetical protein
VFIGSPGSMTHTHIGTYMNIHLTDSQKNLILMVFEEALAERWNRSALSFMHHVEEWKEYTKDTKEIEELLAKIQKAEGPRLWPGPR